MSISSMSIWCPPTNAALILFLAGLVMNIRITAGKRAVSVARSSNRALSNASKTIRIGFLSALRFERDPTISLSNCCRRGNSVMNAVSAEDLGSSERQAISNICER